MPYGDYRGRCLGRVLYFIHKYIKSTVADRCRIGADKVTMGNELVATYEWVGYDLPVFKFTDVYAGADRNQTEYMYSALTDPFILLSPPEGDQENLTCLGKLRFRQAFDRDLQNLVVWLDLPNHKLLLQFEDRVQPIGIFSIRHGKDDSHPVEGQVQHLFASQYKFNKEQENE